MKSKNISTFFFHTHKEQMKKLDGRKLTQKTREEIRIRAVKLVESGESPEKVIKALGFHRSSIYNWIARYREGGVDALKTRKITGRPRQLSDKQLKTLEELLLQGATMHGWLNNLWNAKRVGEMIKRHFGVKVSDSQVRRILKKQLGWTSQKPVHQRGERNDDEIEKWKTQEFSRIRKASRKRNAYLAFVDESGFMLAPTRRRTYAPRGHTPVDKVVDPHGRISVICAISVSPIRNRTNLFFHFLPDNKNFNSFSIIKFVSQLQHCISNSMTIIWDSIPIHGSNAVINFLNDKPEIITEKLPAYAPDLNPVDRVWSYLKYGRLANYTPSDLDQLRYTVKAELIKLRKRTDLLHAFIRGTGLDLRL